MSIPVRRERARLGPAPRRRAVRWRRALFALFALAFALAACGPANIVLRRRPEDSTGALGPTARCEDQNRACGPDPVQDTSRWNMSGTAFLSLPHCDHGIDSILLQQVSSAHPVAIVQCAAEGQSSGGIGTTDADGGVQPSQPQPQPLPQPQPQPPH